MDKEIASITDDKRKVEKQIEEGQGRLEAQEKELAGKESDISSAQEELRQVREGMPYNAK